MSKSIEQDSSKKPVAEPLPTAPNGEKKQDDGSDTRQQQQAMPPMDNVAAAWVRQIGVATGTWSKLTESELQKTGGQVQKLAELVEERYVISRDEAEKQVRSFFSATAG